MITILMLLVSFPVLAANKLSEAPAVDYTLMQFKPRKCKHGHWATPIDWTISVDGNTVNVKVCPFCLHKLLQREAGY
jgi:hypothetical protein